MKYSDEYLRKVIEAMRERITFIHDLFVKSPYFFGAPSVYDEDAVKKRWKAETPSELKKLAEVFESLTHPKKNDFEAALQGCAGALNIEASKLIHATRLAVSGMSGGPGVYDILEILGKEESIQRIHTAMERIH
jgi:glutamyl-tRNA synthetase